MVFGQRGPDKLIQNNMISIIKKRNWSHLIIHHSADKDDLGLDFDNYLDYHVRVRMWQDLGYHGVNEEVEGHSINIYGRPFTRIGAHCRGMNSKSLGFCFAGNFNLEAGPKDARIIDAVRRVIVPWIMYWDIPVEKISPHRKYAKTDCPGKLFRWDKLIKEINIGIQNLY